MGSGIQVSNVPCKPNDLTWIKEDLSNAEVEDDVSAYLPKAFEEI